MVLPFTVAIVAGAPKYNFFEHKKEKNTDQYP
ncbi:hypothetical protein SDC9_209546 [bioreactor metagenome]|uniref:Uncharacterized protein n=1 Tax=bioreactor metagenome TaxID=1076179 RepID=A0A645JF42_9ZZZZ